MVNATCENLEISVRLSLGDMMEKEAGYESLISDLLANLVRCTLSRTSYKGVHRFQTNATYDTVPAFDKSSAQASYARSRYRLKSRPPVTPYTLQPKIFSDEFCIQTFPAFYTTKP